MPFRILDCETNEPVYSAYTSRIMEFDTGDEAQQVAKLLAADNEGKKFRVKKVLNTKWRERERQKFSDGTYQPLPWSGATWWHDNAAIAIHQNQFPHPSRKVPGMLAYIESEEKGMDNIVTRCKAGKYLTQFDKILRIYGVSADRLAKDFAARYEPRMLRFATTEDEIQWVYENGPASCMSTIAYRAEQGWGYPSRGQWPTGQHVCRTYAAGDLQVAWLAKDEDKPNKKGGVAARALVWPEKKTHSRVYGDEHKINNALIQAGYRFNPPIGAKIQRWPVQGGRFAVPYIDRGSGGGQGSLAVLDKQTHLEICDHRTAKSYAASSTTGVSGRRLNARGEEMEAHICEQCGAEHGADPIFLNGSDHRFLCEACQVPAHVFRCNYDGRLYSGDHMNRVNMANGQVWSQRAFSSRGFTCQGNGNNYNRDEALRIQSGELWSTEYARDHAFRCAYSGNWYRNEFKVECTDYRGSRMVWAKEVFDLYGFHCVSCDRDHWDPDQGHGSMFKGPCRTCKAKAAQAAMLAQAGAASVNAVTQSTPTDEVRMMLNAPLSIMPPDFIRPDRLRYEADEYTIRPTRRRR